ncbi:MAG: RidA family protein [bacterium]
MTHRALEPEGWPSPKGYSNGVLAKGTMIVLAGQIGWNPATGLFDTDDFVLQVRQALANVATLLAHAGAEPRHLVRLTWFITDRDAYIAARREIGVAYRDVMGRNYPPMSVVVVSALIEARALVEIEATALLPS